MPLTNEYGQQLGMYYQGTSSLVDDPMATPQGAQLAWIAAGGRPQTPYGGPLPSFAPIGGFAQTGLGGLEAQAMVLAAGGNRGQNDPTVPTGVPGEGIVPEPFVPPIPGRQTPTPNITPIIPPGTPRGIGDTGGYGQPEDEFVPNIPVPDVGTNYPGTLPGQYPTGTLTPFGPDSNLIDQQINWVTPDVTQEQLDRMNRAAQDLDDWSIPDIQRFDPFADTERSAKADELAGIAEGILNGIVPPSALDQTQAQDLLNQALQNVNGAEAYRNSMGELMMRLPEGGGDVFVGSENYNAALEQAFQLAGRAAAIDLQSVPGASPIDMTRARELAGQAAAEIMKAQLSTFGAVSPTNVSGYLNELNVLKAQAGQATQLSTYGDIQFDAARSEQLINQAINHALGASIPNYGGGRTTPTEGTTAALNSLRNQLAGIGGELGAMNYRAVPTPSDAGVQRRLENSIARILGLEVPEYGASGAADLARQLMVQGITDLENVPNRDEIAKELMRVYNEEQAIQRQLGIEQIGQGAATFGRLGSGMVTTSLGDMEIQLELQRERETARLAAENAQYVLADKIDTLNAYISAGHELTSQDILAFQAAEQEFAMSIQQEQAANTASLQGYSASLQAAQFEANERARTAGLELQNAQVRMDGISRQAQIEVQKFGVMQAATAESYQNAQVALQYAQAQANVTLNQAQVMMSGAGQQTNLAQAEFGAASANRAFQAAQEQAQAALTLQSLGLQGNLVGQQVDIENVNFGQRLASQQQMIGQEATRANLALGRGTGLTNLAGTEGNFAAQEFNTRQQQADFEMRQLMAQIDQALGASGQFTNLAGTVGNLDARAQELAQQNEQFARGFNLDVLQSQIDASLGIGSQLTQQAGVADAMGWNQFQSEIAAGDAALRRAGGFTDLAGQQANYDAQLKQLQIQEQDAYLRNQWNMEQALADRLRTQTGTADMMLGWDQAQLNWLAGERDYQYGLSQDEITNAAREFEMQEWGLNQQFQRDMELARFLASIGMDPTSVLAGWYDLGKLGGDPNAGGYVGPGWQPPPQPQGNTTLPYDENQGDFATPSRDPYGQRFG
jgi:hypothetical protein